MVDSAGFNGLTRLDYVGHPSSEKLHVVGKFRRSYFGTLHHEATIEDPVYYTRR